MELRQELERLKHSRRSTRPDDLDQLLRRAGFVRRQGKGDHWVYTHPKRPFPLTVDPRNPLLPAYVSKAIRAIEEVWATMRTLEEYLELPYAIVVVHDVDEDGNSGWVAEVEELPGCMSQGRTPEEAVERVREAMRGWLDVAMEDNVAIPEPRAIESFSGRFVVRVPASLHADLVRSADHEGVSLNQFVTGALAGAVGWPRGKPSRGRSKRQPRVPHRAQASQ